MRNPWRVAGLTIGAAGSFSLSGFYLPVFAKSHYHLSQQAITLALTLGALGNIGCSFWAGSLSDRIGRKPVLILGSSLGAMSYLLLITQTHAAALLCGVLGVNIATGMFLAVMAAFVSDAGGSLCRFSAFSSLGSFAALLLAGWVAQTAGVANLFGGCAAILAATALWILFLAAPESRRVAAEGGFARELFARNAPVYWAFFLRQVSAATLWSLGPLYFKELGGDDRAVGWIPAANTLTQFAVAYWFVDRYTGRQAWRIGAGLSVIAWALWLAPRQAYGMIPVQVVLGTSWAFFYAGTLRVLEHDNPKASGAALGMAQSCHWLAHVAGPALAYAVTSALHSWGFTAQFRVIIGVAVLFSLAGWFFTWRGREPISTLGVDS